VPSPPLLLASSVIRGSRYGESHGGLYLVDLERGQAQLKLDWNTTQIDIAGRGGDRGLRGIAFHGERILVAANSQLLLLDQDFMVVETFTNPFLRHCHEICVAQDHVFLTATGFDSLLVFDLARKRFVEGWHLSAENRALNLRRFDPSAALGPPESHVFHLNAVSASAAGLWFSGLRTPGLLHSDGRRLELVAALPEGTHNAQPFAHGVLYNDTAAERVCYAAPGATIVSAVPDFPASAIVNRERFSSEVARPRFARGLCVLQDGLVAGGSSPSTIALHDMRTGRRLMEHTLSMDVRNAVHGLAAWPY
jgi:hypothetical protein